MRPFAWAARISTRLKPNVHRPRAGRAETAAANSAKPSAAVSEKRWPESASSATESATIPATSSAIVRPAIRTSAIVSARRSAFLLS